MIKILFVCHGNICRSTMAESVLTHMVKQHHIDHLFEINSAATSREEIGNPPHHGTANKLRQVGIPLIPHRAVQMAKVDYEKYDYLIGMEGMNLRNMARILGNDPENKMSKLLDFSDKKGYSNRDIADPWYTGRFGQTYDDIVEGCTSFLEYLKRENKI